MKLNSEQIKNFISEQYQIDAKLLKRTFKNSTPVKTFRIFSDSHFNYAVTTNSSDSIILSLHKFAPFEEEPTSSLVPLIKVSSIPKIDSEKGSFKALVEKRNIYLDPSFENVEGYLKKGEELIFCISKEIDYDFGVATTEVSFVVAVSTNFLFDKEGFECIYPQDFNNPSLIQLELKIDNISNLTQPTPEVTLFHSEETDYKALYQKMVNAGFKYSSDLAKELNENYDGWNDYVVKWKVKP